MTTRAAAISAALTRRDTLAYWAAQAGFLVGSTWSGTSDPAALQPIENAELSLVVPSALSPTHCWTAQTTLSFSGVTPQLSTASANNLAAGGGYLIVHGTEPSWVVADTSAQALTDLQFVVNGFCTQYSGQLDHWIVVNEALNPPQGNAYGFRSCTWLTQLGTNLAAGTDYVTAAFTQARASDSTTPLIYNEYGIEDNDTASATKRAAVLTLLGYLKGRNIIDGLGIQAHLACLSSNYDPGAFKTFLDAVYALGLNIYITEMDVNDRAAPSSFATRDAVVAGKIARFMQTVVAHPGVKNINVWGISDSNSWLNGWVANPQFTREDGNPQRGTLLDLNNGRKPAYYAFRAALQYAAQRQAGHLTHGGLVLSPML